MALQEPGVSQGACGNSGRVSHNPCGNSGRVSDVLGADCSGMPSDLTAGRDRRGDATLCGGHGSVGGAGGGGGCSSGDILRAVEHVANKLVSADSLCDLPCGGHERIPAAPKQ